MILLQFLFEDDCVLWSTINENILFNFCAMIRNGVQTYQNQTTFFFSITSDFLENM